MDITASAAVRALDGLFLRQTVAADNIANANAPGFVPGRVDFETHLRQALGTGSATGTAAAPVLRTPLPGETVRLDQELASMSETTLRYQMVAGLLDARLALHRAALESGRGS